MCLLLFSLYGEIAPAISMSSGSVLSLKSCSLLNNHGDAHGLQVSNVNFVEIDDTTIIEGYFSILPFLLSTNQ
jgi:hypothetical protein